MNEEKRKILVVDDNADNRELLSRRLEKRGYATVCADSGRQALELLQQEEFDLILLDIMMPEISGIEVLEKVRQEKSMAELPVIMATAKDTSEDMVHALKLGANDYITKPIDIDKLLNTISEHPNICNYIHLPVQSGSDRILKLMNRTYTIDHYLKLIEKARKIISGVSFSTDIISGFPTESYEDHVNTLDVMREVRYDGAFMFKYSPREGTKAYSMKDDISDKTKSKRLQKIIELQQQISFEINQELVGTDEVVLVEGSSRKSDDFLVGRTDTNKVVIFPKKNGIQAGDYIRIKISRATQATLFGDFVETFRVTKNLALIA